MPSIENTLYIAYQNDQNEMQCEDIGKQTIVKGLFKGF